jgi:hypothetical protein
MDVFVLRLVRRPSRRIVRLGPHSEGPAINGEGYIRAARACPEVTFKMLGSDEHKHVPLVLLRRAKMAMNVQLVSLSRESGVEPQVVSVR